MSTRPLPFVLALDLPDPLAAFAVLAGERGAMLLDGAAAEGARAQYTILAADPFSWIEAASDGTVRRDGALLSVDPFTALEQALVPFSRPVPPGLPAFTGGAVGVMGYELGRHLERLPTPHRTGIHLPDMAFGLYDTVAVISHAENRAWVLSGAEREADEACRPARARVLAQALHDRLTAAPALARDTGDGLLRRPGWGAELSPATYRDRVVRILDYIRAGDIYQANMTQRFLGRLRSGVTAWDVYRRLRPRTAAPFSAYLNLGQGRAIASGSPERFLSLTAGGAIETRPIKGTRPRHADAARDAALAAELLLSEKDRAENLMIVDLLRNDLSRVAQIGSVKVPSLWGLESYRTVHHLTSVVTGRLKPGLGPVDLLRASFPGGSITGAPKIRAMEIIHELEPARRGPYCGSVMWIGWDGAMDSSIIIRTAAMSGDKVQVQAGGGIVADSEPEAEYQESLTKAKAILTALDPAMAWPPAIAADEAGEQAA
ncbi:aminodeoxychorismate synthase, component I [Niveispirillum lacus]|uniref:aminodeoxychorismate synthase n=1 Tax=Niveispirillum lacus TaxID=1981099 RepID=A0A255YWX6_9PROT|nr:aminodeoxychorismate synthase component I [Niveispirillum lacus]OYQ32920.1 aminodeoxychorismate synthase, component I [Niveispirillum lacus]